LKKITIGSRGSDLALWQANHVRTQLQNLGHEVDIKIIITQGDAIQDLSFDKLEGKGFFTKEIELALLDQSIDIAVHSHKDLETNPPGGLCIGAVSKRESPAELLLISKKAFDPDFVLHVKENGIVGTSSARRKSQLLRHRTDFKITDLRGNVPTRIEKLRSGAYDAILLAKAGVDRLQIDLSEFVVKVLDPTDFVPAPAQGVLGLQMRDDDDEIAAILKQLNDKEVAQLIKVERTILNRLDGGCQLPLGVYCPDLQNLYVSHSTSANEAATVRHYQHENVSQIIDMVLIDLKDGNNEEI
jgi:hydroxymethylbilane synthase